ncbi:VOC family protein [Caballeronia sp. INDeC2]|uniref:VOC family protein n=1 Tax=Caballeronia sp. INDeC2 TaxID=2921747 RepID=UPI002027B88E|nr:VOC family protein [Caballeronia sp. INDeC2]
MSASMHSEHGGPAIHSVHEVVFSAPDLAEAEYFYRAFGLDVRHEGAALALYTFGHPHRWARIYAGARKQLLWLSLGIFEGDGGAFEDKLHSLGIGRAAPPREAEGEDGRWIDGPDGVPIQLVVAEKCAPDIKSKRVFPPETSAAGRAPHRSEVHAVQPNRLSHVLLFTSDVDAARRFYEDVMGLRLSDHSGSIIAFMHGRHGSDHHLIALAKSDGAGLHHTSWDVSSLDDVALGSEQMARAGFAEGWGLGRHVLGSNYFRYVRDPWGSYAEYSFDIDFIAAGTRWPAADHPPEDALYVWGPPVPADFVTNHESL